jgi:hypothetical protein
MDRNEQRKKRPSIRDFFSNLSGPMPLNEKISLLLRNNAIRSVSGRNAAVIPESRDADRKMARRWAGEYGTRRNPRYKVRVKEAL